MKTIIIKTLAVIALTLSTASAIELSDFIGSWRGKHKETVNGLGYTFNTTYEGTRRADGGLLLVSKSNTPMWGLVISRTELFKNGKYKGQATAANLGLIISASTGTWKKSDGEISVSGKGTNTGGTKTFRGRLKLIDQRHFRYSGMSGSTKVVETGTRL